MQVTYYPQALDEGTNARGLAYPDSTEWQKKYLSKRPKLNRT
jgi:hypothetical protein